MYPVLGSSQKSPIEVTKSLTPPSIDKYYRVNSDESTVNLNVSGFGSKGGIIPRDVVFSIDFSISMYGPSGADPHNERLAAARSFIDKLEPNVDRAGVVFWNWEIPRMAPNFVLINNTYPSINLNENKTATWGLTTNYTMLKTEPLNNDSGSAYLGAGTDLNLGLKAAIEILDANATEDSTDATNRAIVFLTDGEGEYAPSGTNGSYTDIAREKGYRIFSVGLNLTNNSNATKAEENLVDMSTATDGMYFNTSSPENLQSIFNSIEHKLRSKTIPSSVDLTQTMQPYVLVNQSSFSISPSSTSRNELGQTVVKWENISKYIGNKDSELSSNELFQVNFSISSSKAGQQLPLDVQGKSFLTLDSNNTKHSIGLPQTYFDAVTLRTDSDNALYDFYQNSTSSYRQGNMTSISSILYPSNFILTTVQPKTINIASGEISKADCFPSKIDTSLSNHSSSSMAEMKLNVTAVEGSESHATPIVVVFAIDSSASMKHNDPNNKRIDAAKMFSDKLDISRDKVGIVSWDNDVDFTFGPSSDLPVVKTNLDAIDSRGGTDLNVGLNDAISLLNSNSSPEPSSKVIIFLSDGQENYTPSGSPGSPADNAKSKGYKIFPIGLNVEPQSAEEASLKDIATATGGQYYFSPTAENLQAIFGSIFQQVVTSTAPKNIDVTEILQKYMNVNQSTFSVTPTSISISPGGNTEILWKDIARHAGNNDTELSKSEVFLVEFNIGVFDIGSANISLPVDIQGKSKINYVDSEGEKRSSSMPSTYINVTSIYCP